MKVKSRISVRPKCVSNSEMSNLIKEIFDKNRKLILDEDMLLFLIPLESNEYKELKKVYEENRDELYYDEDFEIEYTKKEIDEAEAFVVGVESVVCGYGDKSTFDYFYPCCKNGHFVGEQFLDYEIPVNELRNRDLVLSDIYRLFISPKMKDILEKENAKNVMFRPIWTRKNHNEPIAYQIEVEKLLPSIQELNGMTVYKTCSECGKKIYKKRSDKPLYLTQQILDNLEDFNATAEIFTELGNYEIIINRKMFELLNKCGIKKIRFQPIFIKCVNTII